jgi:hypothetical protein
VTHVMDTPYTRTVLPRCDVDAVAYMRSRSTHDARRHKI